MEHATTIRPRASGSPVVSMSGVTVVRAGRPILQGVDWDVLSAERWVVLGPNGSGKTTLLQIAGARLLPSRGMVSVAGDRFGRSDLREVRARVSLVSATTLRALRPSLTVRDVVVTGRDAALLPVPRRYTAQDWAKADRLIARAGRHGLAVSPSASFGTLSDGERQQVLLARALMGAAELILFDEPAAGLDLGARERLVSQIQALASDPDVPAMVLVTHHLEEVPPGFTHALLLADGRVVAAGPLEDVLTSPTVSKCFGVDVEVQHHGGRWSARAVR